MSFSRRKLIRSSFAVPGLTLIPSAFAQPDERFLLHVVIRGGADASYLFDARPKEFTDRGLITNYLGTLQDQWPVRWQDRDGRSTFVSALVDQKLRRFRDQFSIINGVHMAPGFDGHEENIRYAVTGDPAGGELAELQLEQGSAPLSFLLAGFLDGTEAPSLHRGLNISVETAAGLSRLVREDINGAAIHPAVLAQIRSRTEACAGGSGLLARGCGKYAASMQRAGDWKQRVAQVELLGVDEGDVLFRNKLELAKQYFRHGIARSALITVDYDLDAHDLERARRQVEGFDSLTDDLAVLLGFLREPLGVRDQAVADAVTVIVHTEFNRTMRQIERDFAESGTDHNPFSNSVLIAGRGFASGKIFGATDLDRLAEVGDDSPFHGVSSAHRSRDGHLIKIMGKPFEHSTGMARTDLPTQFTSSDYFQFPSLTNSIFASFGVPRDRWLKLDRRGTVAPAVPAILT